MKKIMRKISNVERKSERMFRNDCSKLSCTKVEYTRIELLWNCDCFHFSKEIKICISRVNLSLCCQSKMCKEFLPEPKKKWSIQ